MAEPSRPSSKPRAFDRSVYSHFVGDLFRDEPTVEQDALHASRLRTV